MKDIYMPVFIYLCGLFILYWLGAFMAWDMNPGEWEGVRPIIAMLILIWTVAYAIVGFITGWDDFK